MLEVVDRKTCELIEHVILVTKEFLQTISAA
jgi:hypothetical protein